MASTGIYRDIQKRTGGDIYIGVVGPVRTGKSTFIKRLMDLMVLPKIENEYALARIVDELPQSGSGKTVMTTQPKFVPNEAVALTIGEDGIELRLRMVDCVGYMVEGALGSSEGAQPRMVRTPWFDYDIPFDEAAELGTRKVITEHSTIGIVILTDSDNAGRQIRAYITSFVPSNQIRHAYIPDIYGKEKRKAAPSKEGKLGVEGISSGILLEILKEAGASVGGSTTDFQPLTPADLMSLGLTGGINSATLRQGVLKALDLPENLTTKMLLRWVTSEEKKAQLLAAVEKIKNGA